MLREVGAVEVREDGRQRLYRVNGRAPKPIHDWVSSYERTWNERFGALDAVLDELKRKSKEMTTMPTTGTATVTLPTDEQILVTREFDAPKHLVYKAWTTPELVKRWWSGGRGEVTTCEIDLRVGGAWRYVMLAHGEFEVAVHGEYREIVPDERIVNTEVFEMPGAPPLAPEDEPLNTVTFSEAGGRTTLELLVQTTSKELRDMIAGSGMESGMQEGLDILEQIAISLA
ncbi:MAG: hypothetical protein QOG15_866 [Solirubrobacteraceae bacterium]|nr:hypothetical protein [Solirubrobacteraceae bacterium]